MNNDVISLKAGNLFLDISPSLGGSILKFDETKNGQSFHWFRPAPYNSRFPKNPDEVGCYPLVPFSNRIREGRYVLEGKQYQLPQNFLPEKHSLHGEGWQNPWTVLSQDQNQVDLGFDFKKEGHPHVYNAKQTFKINKFGLSMELNLINTGTHSIAAGMGVHPMFCLSPKVRLTASTQKIWTIDSEFLPLEHIPTPEAFDFTHGKELKDTKMAHHFDWDGLAAIDWPEHNKSLSIRTNPTLRKLVVFTPWGKDFFCVEPVSNTVDAANLMAQGNKETGCKVLQPGEEMTGKISFIPNTILDKNKPQLINESISDLIP